MKNDDKPKAKPTRTAKPRPAKESARERAPRGESAADHLPPIDVDAPTEAVKPGAQPAEPLLAVPPEKRVRIGITGEPGAGKSALARQLGALGGTVIDVDRLGHELLEHPRIKRDLARAFGEDILTGDGEIDRRALAAKAFATADATATLNGIMHPPLAARAKALAAKAGNFVVLDAGLLHEIGLGEECTISIYVKANRDNRVNRVAERLTGWTDAEARGKALADVYRAGDDGALRDRDDVVRPVASSTAPIVDATGTRHGTVLVIRDQTDERVQQARSRGSCWCSAGSSPLRPRCWT